jgi:hypothetical protein
MLHCLSQVFEAESSLALEVGFGERSESMSIIPSENAQLDPLILVLA